MTFPCSTQGYIQVTETGTGKDYGFLSKDLNGFGEFQTTSDPDQRAIFSINLADAAQGQTNIVVVSDPPQMTAACRTLTLSLARNVERRLSPSLPWWHRWVLFSLVRPPNWICHVRSVVIEVNLS